MSLQKSSTVVLEVGLEVSGVLGVVGTPDDALFNAMEATSSAEVEK